jgi:arylsulfatase
MIENIDYNFGVMLEKLTEWNALENTLVIFMTDNGATHLSGTLNGKKLKHFNANLRGGKNSPNEGGTHVPSLWQWQGVLGQGVDVDALAAHIDLYQTFVALAGVQLPEDMQAMDGRSLLPLLQDPKADWPDRELFFHCGRWNEGKREAMKFAKCAVRTEQWRFVNNTQLYDISKDPGETTDVAKEHPEVIAQLRKSYDAWWESVLPLMVNEGLPKVAPADQPLAIRYYKQLKEQGIPDWAPDAL